MQDARRNKCGWRAQHAALAVAVVAAVALGGCGRRVTTAGGGFGGGPISFGADTLPSDATPTAADAASLDAASAVGDAGPAGTNDGAGDAQPCKLGAARCGAKGRELCAKGGWAPAKCDLIAPVCVAGSCRACAPNAKFCADVPLGATHSKAVMTCDATGDTAAVTEACVEGPCVDGKCLTCVPGEHRCNEGAREVCAGGGLLWSPDHCPAATPTCVAGACKVCTPSATVCGQNAVGDDAVLQCDASGGSATIIVVCNKPLSCSGGSCVACKPGSTVCKDGALATCKADGSDYELSSCPAATPACVGGSCKLCAPDGVFCRAATESAVAAVMACGPKGDTASAIQACGADQVCHKSACKSCVPSQAECVGATPLVCALDGGTVTVAKSCAETGLSCGASGCSCFGDQPTPAGGAAGAPYCAPPAVGLTQSTSAWTCDLGGNAGKKKQDCPSPQVCKQGACVVCVAGEQRCEGNKAMVCLPSGQGWKVADDCGAKAQGVCHAGACVDVCALQDGNPTSVGCRFWAVDLDNAKITSGGTTFDAQNAPYGVALVNSGAKPAVVTITYGPSASVPVAKTTQLTLPAGAAQSVVLPPPAWKLPPASLDGTSQQGVAFRIDATGPIAAFQHNPLQSNPFSADASVLLPANALGTTYRVMVRKQSIANLRAYVAIVATRPGTTKVTVTPTAATVAGGAVPALTPGVPYEISIQTGQVLNLETAQVGGDLTGTLVTATKPVAVFAGSEAAHAPDTDTCVPNPAGSGKVCVGTNKTCLIASDCAQTCCADHLEAQLPPVSAWGTAHVAAQLQARGAEPSVWRVLAAHNGTKVLIRPEVTPLRHLQAGEWFEVLANKDLVIESTKPVLVGQFMASSGLTGKSLGDPAFAVLPPVGALGRTLRFWVPSTVPTNYVSIATATGASLTLDGTPKGAGVALPHAGWSVWRLPVTPGFHTLKSTRPVSAVLHGWSKDGSYGHAVGYGVH